MDIWQYMLQKEGEFARFSVVPDRELDRMFQAAPDSQDGKRGRVAGNLVFPEQDAYLLPPCEGEQYAGHFRPVGTEESVCRRREARARPGRALPSAALRGLPPLLCALAHADGGSDGFWKRIARACDALWLNPSTKQLGGWEAARVSGEAAPRRFFCVAAPPDAGKFSGPLSRPLSHNGPWNAETRLNKRVSRHRYRDSNCGSRGFTKRSIACLSRFPGRLGSPRVAESVVHWPTVGPRASSSSR
jgi:hypothetical protein